MKIAILTMFNGIDRTYSLVNVVAEHLTMLLSAGFKPKLLVSQDCPDTEKVGVFADERIEWVKITNRFNDQQITWYDYSQPSGKVHDSFFKEADTIAKDFVEHLADVDICFMHDILYQGWHLLHNVAIRKAQQDLPNVKFIAFTHSAPANRPRNPKWPFSARYTHMPNTIYLYPTQAGISALAKQYDVPEGRCRVVNNSLDLLADMSNEVRELAKKIDLISPDFLIVYPGRLTTGKRFEKVAALGGAIKRVSEKTVKIIYCEFPSMDIEPSIYKKQIREYGCKFGLEYEDMYFTSDCGFPYGFPRNGVLELFTLSNLFICPSYSESFGLTVLEAASRGNFIVLNQAVPALEELGKTLNAYYMRWDARNFGYDTKEKYHPSEQAYLEENGNNIVNIMRENQVILAKTKVRQRYSPNWIWKNQFAPLLE